VAGGNVTAALVLSKPSRTIAAGDARRDRVFGPAVSFTLESISAPFTSGRASQLFREPPMKNEELQSKLAAAISDRSLVRITRSFEDDGVDGYVVALSEKWLLFLLVSQTVTYEGFQAFRLQNVESIEIPSPRAAFYKAALRKRKLRRPSTPKLNLSSARELVCSAGKRFPLISLHCDKFDPYSCHIGQVVSASSTTVSLLEVTLDAEWESVPTSYHFAKLISVNFGGPYEEALASVAGKPKKSLNPPVAPRVRRSAKKNSLSRNSQSCASCWQVPNTGWEDVDRQIDLFLAASIREIVQEYADEPVEWLEINRWPDSGRLIVFPSRDLKGNRDERICCQMFSDYLQAEWDRSAKLETDSQNEAWNFLDEKVWQSILHALQHGAASQVLAEARSIHRLRVAAYDYDLHEGIFRLPDLSVEATEEMQRELEDFKKQYGVID